MCLSALESDNERASPVSYKTKKKSHTSQSQTSLPGLSYVRPVATTAVPPFKLANRYQQLADRNDDVNGVFTPRQVSTSLRGSDKHTRPVVKPQDKPAKAPSITITSSPTQSLYTIVNQVSESHSFLGRSNEHLIFPKTVDDHTRIMDELRQSNIPFYTDPTTDKSRFKQVLFGIPHMPIDDILNELEQHDINPISVEYIPSKIERENHISPLTLANQEMDTLRSYLFEFSPGDVTREKLLDVKCIGHHICKWRDFKNSGKGPTLCNRCCMFGHGQRNCGRDPVCAICSEAHLTSDCRLICSNNTLFSCINCINNKSNHQHKANDPDCPSRGIFRNNRRRTSTASFAIKVTVQTSGSIRRSRSQSRQTSAPKVKSKIPTKYFNLSQSRAAVNTLSYAEAVKGNRWQQQAGSQSNY